MQHFPQKLITSLQSLQNRFNSHVFIPKIFVCKLWPFFMQLSMSRPSIYNWWWSSLTVFTRRQQLVFTAMAVTITFPWIESHVLFRMCQINWNKINCFSDDSRLWACRLIPFIILNLISWHFPLLTFQSKLCKNRYLW